MSWLRIILVAALHTLNPALHIWVPTHPHIQACHRCGARRKETA